MIDQSKAFRRGMSEGVRYKMARETTCEFTVGGTIRSNAGPTTTIVSLVKYRTLTSRYPGRLDFTNFVRDNGLSETADQVLVQGNLEFIEIHTE